MSDTPTDELIRRLRDHENEGVTQSDRFYLREEAADALTEANAKVAALEAALAKAIQQNECDMLLTGDELRQMRAALLPAQQPGGQM